MAKCGAADSMFRIAFRNHIELTGLGAGQVDGWASSHVQARVTYEGAPVEIGVGRSNGARVRQPHSTHCPHAMRVRATALPLSSDMALARINHQPRGDNSRLGDNRTLARAG